MLEHSESLDLLQRQLIEKKQELTNATLQLNRSKSKLERAEAEALLACNHNSIWKMAHEHQLQAGHSLLSYNLELEKLQSALNKLQMDSSSQLNHFQHFIRVAQRALSPHLRSSLPAKVWQSVLARLADELNPVLSSHAKLKHAMTHGFKLLSTGRQRRSFKIKQFQETMNHCLIELTKSVEKQLQHPDLEILQMQIRKQLEKRMQCVREIQRYQHVLDNILGMAQQKEVMPAKTHCEIVQTYIHTVQQEQITILAKIRLLRNPELAANDVLIDDDPPKEMRPKKS